MTVATYLAATESAGLMSSSVEHKCRLCDKGVLQTQKTLSYHMLVKHGFDLEDYYEVRHSSYSIRLKFAFRSGFGETIYNL